MYAITGIFRYLSEVRQEIKQVTWPTRGQTTRLTLLVIIVSLVVGLATGLIDIIFTEVFRLIISR